MATAQKPDLEAFATFLKQHPQFQEALSIVRSFQARETWLIGSFLFGTLLYLKRGLEPLQPKDFDFVLDTPTQQPQLPPTLHKTTNRFGSTKIIASTYDVDCIPLQSVSWILDGKMTPTIENFLTGTSLTIQSMAYNVESGELVGDVGIAALDQPSFAIHNRAVAEASAAKYGITPEMYLENKKKQFLDLY